MYERFFNLRERPFDLTTNPRFMYLSARHKEALTHLRYGIVGRKGLTVLIGEVGTGKTTIIRAALAKFTNPNSRIVYVGNPLLTRSEFFELLALGFDLPRAALTSKSQFILELSRTLTERYEAGHVSALVIDEAQSLPRELLEEIRLLTNIETSTEKLLPVVLAGQSELAARLNEEPMRQLKQRVSLRCVLTPFDLHETATYMATRIRLAGGDIRQLFTPAATALIYARSRGIPRVVNVICDNALLSAFAANRRPVDGDIVGEVCRDFDLRPPRPADQLESLIAPDAAPGRTGVRASSPSPHERDEAHAPSESETQFGTVQPTTPFMLLPTRIARRGSVYPTRGL